MQISNLAANSHEECESEVKNLIAEKFAGLSPPQARFQPSRAISTRCEFDGSFTLVAASRRRPLKAALF